MKSFLYRAFLPHSENDYTPDVLPRGALFLMGALAIITFTLSNIAALLWQQSDWLVGAVLPAVVVSETNSEREDLSLPVLRRNAVLDAAAQLKAEHMAKEGYFAHYSPGGVSPWHWFGVAGYSFVHAGENLAVHFTDSDEVVEAWMKSPTHRANIVNGNYQEIGVGTARGKYEGYNTVFVVQLFGTPAKPQETLLPITVAPEPVTATRTPAVRVAGAEVVREVYNREEALALAVETDLVPVPVAPTTTTRLTVDNTVVVMSETIATSTNLPPADLPVTEIQADSPADTTFGALTSPRTILHYLYLFLGVIAMVALVASVFVEWRIARPRQIMYGVSLLLLLSLLFYIHIMVTSGVVIS